MSLVSRGLGVGSKSAILVTAGLGLRALRGQFGGGGFVRMPRDLLDAQRLRMISADDLLLMMAGAAAAGLLH